MHLISQSLILLSAIGVACEPLHLCMRNPLRILIGLLAGHVDLNRHLTLMKVRSDPVCPLCQQDEETTFHLLVRCDAISLGWWRGVVGDAFRLKRSYSTPGSVSTAMGDCLRAGKPSRCEACQLGRLSLLPSAGR